MTEHHYERDVSWRARYRAFIYAGRGIRTLLATQWNARIHAVIAAAVICAGFFFSVSVVEWCFLVLAIAMVWVTEALNTALELVIDLVSPQIHPLAGKAKDVAAGAVLSATLAAVAIGLIVLLPKALAWLGVSPATPVPRPIPLKPPPAAETFS